MDQRWMALIMTFWLVRNTVMRTIKYNRRSGPYLKHRNYICINGRPLVVILSCWIDERPKGNPCLLAGTLQESGCWRTIYLWLGSICVLTWKIGFDAGLEFPHWIVRIPGLMTHQFLQSRLCGVVYDYRDMVIENVQPLKRQGVTFRGVTPGWDNEARNQEKGFFIHSTPTFYQRWLEQVSLEQTRKFPQEERLIFINAWMNGRRCASWALNRNLVTVFTTTRDALENVALLHFQNAKGSVVENPVRKNENAVVIHAYYLKCWKRFEIIWPHMAANGCLHFHTKTGWKVTQNHLGLFQKRIWWLFPTGRDIGPFIEIFRRIRHLKYQTLLKIHTKKYAHREDGDKWRKDIYDKLLTPLGAKNAIEELVNNESIGIIGPQAHVLDYRYYWGSNRRQTLELARQLGVPAKEVSQKLIVAGTMFWAKPEALGTWFATA